MCKDRVYFLKIALWKEGFNIASEQCGCPAGKGPTCTCKHIASLAYALVDFCKTRTLHDYQTCTDHLKEWNEPRKSIQPIPVDMLGPRGREVFPPKVLAYGSMTIYDPCLSHLRTVDQEASECLRRDLLTL